MGSCQGPAREGEPVPSARRLQHNLAIILVSTFHIGRQGRREKPAETYNKDSRLSGIHLPEQILLFLLGQWQEGLKVSRRGLYRWKRGAVWGGCRSLVWPPTSHPYCPERTQRLLSNSSGQRFGQTCQAGAAVWICLKPPPVTNQEAERGNSLSSETAFCKL